jgi:HPt (histidine-containing phosphotransfer) domain-containing protein
MNRPSPLSTSEAFRQFDPHLALETLQTTNLLAEAAGAFVEMYPGLVSQTDGAARQLDWPALRMAAHSWKGACCYVGAREAAELAAALEQRAVERNSEGLAERIGLFLVVLEELQAEIRQWLASGTQQELR